MINRHSFIKMMILLLTGIYTSDIGIALEEKGTRPNILIILADDATYSDLPLYGGQNVTTPCIDGLASQGIMFSHAYLTMPMCVPCRTELYTGLYPMRNGCCWNHSPARPGTKSICHYMRDLGYRVGLTGKLHVRPRSCFPFDMVEGFESNCVAPTANYDCTGIQKYMESNKNQPFCLVIGLVVPHVVWTVGDPNHFDTQKLKLPDNLVDTPETRRDYADYLAEIEYLDKQIGDILDTLERSGCSQDTLVIFSSEQGSQFPGCKWTNYECGVHTGFVARWPGHIRPGSRTDAMIQYADVLPTLIEAAGGKIQLQQFDGRSFLDVLLGKRNIHRHYVYTMHNNVPDGPPYPIRSVRGHQYCYIRNLLPDQLYINNWIMVVDHTHYWDSWMLAAEKDKNAVRLINRFMKRPAEELYDLRNDPYQLNNLSNLNEYAGIKNRLSVELNRWMKEQNDPGAALDSHEVFGQAREAHYQSQRK